MTRLWPRREAGGPDRSCAPAAPERPALVARLLGRPELTAAAPGARWGAETHGGNWVGTRARKALGTKHTLALRRKVARSPSRIAGIRPWLHTRTWSTLASVTE